MSDCRWCDIGQHPFPAGQPGATTLKVEEYVKNQWGGSQPHDEVREACAACAKDNGLRDLKSDVSQEQVDNMAARIRARTGGLTAHPRVAIGSGVPAPGQPEKKLVDADEYDRYIKYLEKQEGTQAGLQQG